MDRYKMNVILEAQDVVYNEDEFGDKKVDVTGSFKFRARQRSLRVEDIERYKFKSDFEILVFTTRYSTAQQLNNAQKIVYNGDIYDIAKIESNNTYRDFANVYITRNIARGVY